MKSSLLVFASCALIASMATAVRAADSTAVAPSPSSNPVLASLERSGAKFYYLGAHAGLDGWLIVKDKQVQMAYVPPAGKSALIGALFGENGENVSAKQVEALVERNEEVKNIFVEIQKEQIALAQVGAKAEASSADTSAKTAMPAVALSPGERLIKDLSSATTVVVGKPKAPEILMVMSPSCEHCKTMWKSLREPIAQGLFHLRMVPVALQDTNVEVEAAVLLTKSEPMLAWDQYVSGDAAALGGKPAVEAVQAVRNNVKIVANWQITKTPYFVYRGRDGKVKVVQGAIKDLSLILKDLGG